MKRIKDQQGLIKTILLVIIGVALLVLLGIDPVGFWEDLVVPVINAIWNFFVAILGGIVRFFTDLFT